MVILCIFIVIFLLLLAVTAMYPPRPTLSHFELQRRADNGDKEADLALDRLDLRADIITFLRIIEVLLLVVTVLLSIVAFGWLVGTIIAVVVALEYAAVARLQPVKALSQKLYDKIEPTMIDVVDTLHVPLRFVRGYIEEAHPRLVGSREELLHVIHESKGVLGTDETRLITHALAFGDLTVSKVMTPRSMIDTISQEELLGPLVLSDLHATGHTRIPVIEGDIDHVVGTLYLQDLLIVAGSKTKKASHAMEPKVFYIHECGLPPRTIKPLEEAGIDTLYKVMSHQGNKLDKVKGIGQKLVGQIVYACELKVKLWEEQFAAGQHAEQHKEAA
jgi:CBS domain containing-hemolysin-like protein